MEFAMTLAQHVVEQGVLPEFLEEYDQGTPPRGKQRFVLANARLTSDCFVFYDYPGSGFDAFSNHRNFYVRVFSKAYTGASERMEMMMNYLINLTKTEIRGVQIDYVSCVSEAVLVAQEDTALTYAATFRFMVLRKEG